MKIKRPLVPRVTERPVNNSIPYVLSILNIFFVKWNSIFVCQKLFSINIFNDNCRKSFFSFVSLFPWTIIEILWFRAKYRLVITNKNVRLGLWILRRHEIISILSNKGGEKKNVKQCAGQFHRNKPDKNCYRASFRSSKKQSKLRFIMLLRRRYRLKINNLIIEWISIMIQTCDYYCYCYY